MNRYAEYKDSGIEWIGEIPSHWERQETRNHFQVRFIKGKALQKVT